MIKKINNKDEKFYMYMGRIFGSRIIQNQTSDRIYDDDNKEWYVNIEEEKVVAFVSISNNVIKNVYTIKDSYLEDVFKKVKKENEITFSTVTNLYEDVYKKSKFKVSKSDGYKNFVVISL